MNPKPLLLIVEDDPLIRATLEMLLLDEGYEVLSAPDGQVALDLLLAGAKPAMILSDIRMPNKNGHELLQSLRQLPAFDDVPFVFLSAKAAVSDVCTGMVMGADDYISKPFDPVTALESIRVRLALAKRIRSARREPT
ncbi:MAG: response regulator [Opitutae bacterium]